MIIDMLNDKYTNLFFVYHLFFLFFTFLCSISWFPDGCLKSLSHNCHISVILALESSGFLLVLFCFCFFTPFEIFLVFGMMNNFLLKYGHVECYGMRIWMLFKPSVVGIFLWNCSSKRRRAPHCCCHVEVRVCIPHLASVDAQGSSFH